MDNAIFNNGETDAELLLRLADLMEQGAVGKRQITGQYFELDGNGVCAIGAALTAAGVKPMPSDMVKVNDALGVKTWPRIPLENVPSIEKIFAAYQGTAPLPDVIIHLNDRVGLDFAHIIQWLRNMAAQAINTSPSSKNA